MAASVAAASIAIVIEVLFCGCSWILPSSQDIDRWHRESQALLTAFEPEFQNSPTVHEILTRRPGRKITVNCIMHELYIEACWPDGKTITKDGQGRDVATWRYLDRLTREETLQLAQEAQRILRTRHLAASARIYDATPQDTKSSPAIKVDRYGSSLHWVHSR